MYFCEVCGRAMTKKIKLGGYILCNKHMHQLHKHGKFLDSIARTNNDLNDYKILNNDTVEFNLYNQKNEYIGSFLIDKDDIERIKYHKWRVSHDHIVTGSGKGNTIDLSHLILGISDSNVVVDHISGNAYDNRKSNLRACTQAENTLNKKSMCTNTSGYIGIAYDKARNAWAPEIQLRGKRVHLGRYKVFEEAIYARYVAEVMLFKEYQNEQEATRKLKATKNLSAIRKEEISQKIHLKLSANYLGN